MFFDLKVFETKLRLPSEETKYYPMIKYRIRLLVQHMLKKDTPLKEKLLNGTSECSLILKDMINEIDKYLQDEDDLRLWSEKNKEWKLFESTLVDVISYTKNEIEKKKSGGYLQYENIDKLFTMLKRNLPVNELNNKPVDIMEIIFTGWIYYTKIDKDSQGDDFVFNYKLLMRLLLKSLHSSYTHKKYLNKVKK
jgi:DNA replicative helicase MCM subunit Mcm2 (Cdc46/Mcm family)